MKEQRSIPCRFDWNRYPYDSQHCTIVLESYGYSTSDITYSLRTNPVTLEDTTFYHPEYQINTQVRAEIKNSTFAAGTFTRVELVVELQRNHKHFGEIFVAPMMLVILSLFALKLTDKLTLIVCIIGFLLTAFILLMVIVFNSFLQAKYSSVVTRYFVMCGFQLFLELFLVFLATFISPVTQCDAEAPINNRVRDTIVHRTKLYIMGPNNKTHRLMNFIFVLSFCFLLFWVILFWICVAPTY